MPGTPRGLLEHLRLALRLSARNRLALIYGYLFPLLVLVSFVILYRFESPLLIRHMGELLTVGVLGGACFGLPTSLVSERERGVWRRYRLTPVSTGTLVASALLARYVSVIGVALLQLSLAMAIGRWVPAHPFDLWLACSLVAFALLGIGLVLAALADTVPAVQALAQCIFLPMLIIGGVAVRLENLPDWLLPVTAFVPGRYAVEAIQESITGGGRGTAGFALSALLLIGAAGCLAGAKLFRWDSEARSLSVRHKSWITVALASWVVVGSLAVQRGELAPRRATLGPALPIVLDRATATNAPDAPAEASPAMRPPEAVTSPPSITITGRTAAPAGRNTVTTGSAVADEGWRALTPFDFAALPLDRVPPDAGNVSPIASDDETATGSSVEFLTRIEKALPTWAPGHVPDHVQRVRNYLLLLGVADYAQSPLERFLPGTVLTQMLKEFPPADLAKLICWVALHPDEGDVFVLNDPLLIELGAANLDADEVRTRTYYYGVKLTRRVIGW